MRWEFLGKQELRDSDAPGKGYTYVLMLWRAPVPGGWLLMTLNSKSNDPQPMLSFYPDADHIWKGKEPPEAEYLLRPTGADSAPSSEHLLRPVPDEHPEPKRLESE